MFVRLEPWPAESRAAESAKLPFRRAATRYDKLAVNFLSSVILAASTA
jgi:hypothetical protein